MPDMTDAEVITDETTLEERLSRPTPALIERLATLEGDFMLLGAGGKMGPSLARMLQRARTEAGRPSRVIAVSRFSNPTTRHQLEAANIETIAGDLLDVSFQQSLPDIEHIILMTGMKFGSTGNESLMWAMNTLLPAQLGERFRDSRWLAFSTGNIYAMTTPESGGSTENDTPNPVGEYGMSALGRERMLEYVSRQHKIEMSIVRLNYACDLRYGVLVDLAQKVWSRQPVNLAMGYFNTIWQGDANDIALQSLPAGESPPRVTNLTGLETLKVREVCEQFGRLMNRDVTFEGSESGNALLSNAQTMAERFATPSVSEETLIRWVAHWIQSGQPLLGKPTHFETRNGRF